MSRAELLLPTCPRAVEISQYGATSTSTASSRCPSSKTRPHPAHPHRGGRRQKHPQCADGLKNRWSTSTAPARAAHRQIVSDARPASSSQEASDYLKALLEAVLMYLGINDGNLEEGSLRCDANVSVRSPCGQRRRSARAPSFKNMSTASASCGRPSTARSRARVAGAAIGGGRPLFKRRAPTIPDWRDAFAMRSKEDADEYRYFPEPDLPPLRVDRGRLDRPRVRRAPPPQLPELPAGAGRAATSRPG